MTGFQFKQFRVEHQFCAMKVGTDGILLGSWAQPDGARSVLDIGTGSGLLALMMAQKTASDCSITGIDSELSAVQQARGNCRNSPWCERLQIVHCALQAYRVAKPFELIISNPPFFKGKAGPLSEHDPHYVSPSRRTARHTFGLTFTELFNSVSRLLSDDGRFYCILPAQQPGIVELAATHGLHCHAHTEVFSTQAKPAFRDLFCFASSPAEYRSQQLTIYTEKKNTHSNTKTYAVRIT